MKELTGPWLFGVGLFSALLMAATYLGRIAGFIVDQVPPSLIGQLVMLLMPAILVKTFTMAVLLAALLAFGRLSSDSEIVALRAGGASIYRIVAPVAAFSLLIALVTFWFDEQVVPSSARKSEEIQKSIARSKEIKVNQPIAKAVVIHQKLVAFVNAENVNPATQALQGVSATFYDENEKPKLILRAKELEVDLSGIENGNYRWKINGGAVLTDADFQEVTRLKDGAWPKQLPAIPSFGELTAGRNDAFDLMSMNELKTAIVQHREKGDWKDADIHNAEYGYWNKISVPLAAFVFGTLGAVLGIRNHRTGTAAGFALAIGIIFGYVTLANFMNVWAMSGVLPAYVASFAPITLGLIASGIIMWRRNS